MRPAVLVTAAAILVAPACSASGSPEARTEPPGVVVASFDFPESHLLAEIYAQALEDDGVAVRRELGLGQRELVLPALGAGLVDVVPEYAGSALDATAPGAATVATDVEAVVATLQDAVAPWGLTVLAPSAASNQNVVAVAADVAADLGLRDVSDLAPHAGALVVGGPPECPHRDRCLRGLADRYRLKFARFVPLAGADLVRRAIEDRVVDVGVLFSTDAVLGDDDLVVLADDRGLQPPDNVVPMVRVDALGDDRVAAALDEVSRRLTTTSLRFLNWRVAHAGTSIGVEAHGWLVRHGLVAR